MTAIVVLVVLAGITGLGIFIGKVIDRASQR